MDCEPEAAFSLQESIYPLIFFPRITDAATKGAIVSFTRSLSVQLSPKGIRANAIAFVLSALFSFLVYPDFFFSIHLLDPGPSTLLSNLQLDQPRRSTGEHLASIN